MGGSVFDPAYFDILKEIGNIGAGNAATSLAKMIGRKVDMSIPKVQIVGFGEVADILGGAEKEVIGILVAIGGDVSGLIMFIADRADADKVLDMLLGDARGPGPGYGEMEASALKEAGNIMTGAYVGALSMLTGLRIEPSIPDLSADMAGAILSVPAIMFGQVGDHVLFIETRFEGETSVSGNFFLIPDHGSYGVLLKALGVD
ncbi:MAG: chemotaxis protein CheC [Oscillospiraceae bacterium]|nr:chemotaxis protein CheC [Oscillospiraceae bacterium]